MANVIRADTAALDRTVFKLLRATSESANDIINYAANRFVTEVVPLTIRVTGRRRGAGMSSSVATARREHLAYLRERILEKRMKRYGSFSRSGRLNDGYWKSIHISKQEARKGFAVAKRRQGELAAGWNAAAQATKAKVPAWVKRHGNVHGTYGVTALPGSVVAEIKWEHFKGDHGNMRTVTAMALKNVVYKLENTKTKLVAANIRRHTAKLRR